MSAKLGNVAEMIRMGAPRLIQSDEELEEYAEALFRLTAKSDATPDEERAIELPTILVERYESERYPVPDVEPVDVFRFLLTSNRLSQRDLIPELGSESSVSLVLSGKRQLNREHIARLSKRFQVSPAVFFGNEITRHEAIRLVLLSRKSRTATTKEISEEIEKRHLYSRKDGGAAKPQQINARVRKHPGLFEFAAPGVVRLIERSGAKSQPGRAA
jgi:HTH-type transcriptional regulator / antitoxin HigA